MWLITGPFEPAQSEDGTATTTKLLKTNRAYGVGRHNDSALTINNKKVSRKNGEFLVGEHPVDEVSNAAFVPTLSLRNNKSAVMKVSRGSDAFIVNPDSTYELESGDIVRLASNVNATVTWDPKICFHSPDGNVPPFDPAACAAVGVKVVTKHSRDVTHHITANITTPLHSSILLSLLNPAWVVNGEWLLELIRRAQVADEHEKTYDPPLESGYRPQADHEFAEHNPTMADDASWKPNKNRKGLFNDIRFIFVVIGSGIGSATKAMSDIVSRGGADRQLINVEREAEQQAKGAGGTWATVLKKRKTVLKEGMRSGLVLVGDHEAMTARGVPKDIRKAWEVMVENATSVNMRVIHPSLISEAIFNADVSLLDCVTDEGAVDSSSNAQPLPEFIPSTLPEEPSQLPLTAASRPARASKDDGVIQAASQASQDSAPGPSRRLTRRATSRTPVPEPAPPQVPMQVEEPPQSAPKKLLKRRARTGTLMNELLGLDDSAVMDSQLSQGESTPQPDPVPPTSARPGRLKRRVGTAAAGSQSLLEDLSTRADDENQPLKKLKALFEESGQGRITSQSDGEAGSLDGGGGNAGTQLPVVIEEEEEESQGQTQTRTQTRKRKADTMADGDPTSADVEMRDAVGASTAKRRAIEAVNAVGRSQKPDAPAVGESGSHSTTLKSGTKTSKKGAMPGEPDTDPSFLRAIASNKRGKRAEDDFDREFNQLRIAKPVINTADRRAPEAVQSGREWEGLDNFEKDVGIRGNFMQIVELKVWKDVRDTLPGKNMRRESGIGARIDWDGREDFKKFKRKTTHAHKDVVKLVLSDWQDGEPEAPHFNYGGNTKARGFDESQSQSQINSYPLFTQTPSSPKLRPKSQPKSRLKSKGVVEELGEEDEVEDEIGKFGSNARGKSQAAGRGKLEAQAGQKKQPLFDLDSEEEDAPPEPYTFNEETLDNAEEPDMTLRSSKGISQAQTEKPKTRGTKRKIVLEEDSDSDQGLKFGGFSKKAKKR